MHSIKVGLDWKIKLKAYALVNASINWQISKLGVLLRWYHMHLHLFKSHSMSYNYVVVCCWLAFVDVG